MRIATLRDRHSEAAVDDGLKYTTSHRRWMIEIFKEGPAMYRAEATDTRTPGVETTLVERGSTPWLALDSARDSIDRHERIRLAIEALDLTFGDDETRAGGPNFLRWD